MTEIEIIWRVVSREAVGENGRKGSGNKRHEWYVPNRQGEVNSII